MIFDGRTRHRLLISLLALSVPLVFVGCGDDGGGKDSGSNNGGSSNDGGMRADGGGSSTDGGASSSGFGEVRSSKQRVKNPNVGSQQLKKLTRDNTDFAFDLYDEVGSKEKGKNLFYSPHSISSALAMTYAGAEGKTESEMKSKLHPTFNKLDLTLEKRAKQSGGKRSKGGSPFQLNIANSVWGQQNFQFEQPFLDTLARHYGAGLRVLDFQSQPEASRKTINKWVAKKTEDTIEELLGRGSITPSTRMVLTNAIYFNASWKHKFDENKTEKAPFQTPSGEVQADMMHLKSQNGLGHAEGSNYKAVELPYVGDKVSMVVVVPDDGKFQMVEQKLSGQWVTDLFDKLSESPLIVEMPKFTYETKFSAKKMLENLGMTTAFEASANFDGMSKPANLFLQDVIHKAFVAVDEKGTEASAATAVTVGVTSVPEFEQVTADRPFLFFIQDRETDTVIFAGRVLDPTQ